MSFPWEMLKPNYGDFYKFLISAGILILIFSIFMGQAYFSLNRQDAFLFFGLLGLLDMGVIFLACIKWYSNQKIHDEMLRKEKELMEIRIETQKLALEKTKEEVKEVVEGKAELEDRPLARNFFQHATSTSVPTLDQFASFIDRYNNNIHILQGKIDKKSKRKKK